MYDCKNKRVILEIPKNGSRSLVYAAMHGTGKKWFKCQGHHTLEDFCERLMPNFIPEGQRPVGPIQVLAITRDPEQRLVSQVRQAIRKKEGMSVGDALRVCIAQSDVVFKPQSAYLDYIPQQGIDLRLFPIERIHEAMQLVAHERVPHFVKNEGKAGASAMAILTHALAEQAMEKFGSDWEWHRIAKTSGPDGVLP